MNMNIIININVTISLRSLAYNSIML